MDSYEYTVIPAPARAGKASPGKTSGERFAATLAEALNGMAAEGWEYVRAEVLPAEERSGLTGRSTVYHNLLVFRRALAGDPDAARQMAGAGAAIPGDAAGASARMARGQPAGPGDAAWTAPQVASDGREEQHHGPAGEVVASPPVVVPEPEGRDRGRDPGAGDSDSDGQAGRRVADAPARPQPRPAAQPALAAPVRTPFSRAMPVPAQQPPAAAAAPRPSEPPLTRPRPAPASSCGPRLGPASR